MNNDLIKLILSMKVRKHDVDEMLKFNPKILEFHFSDSDRDLTLDKTFEQKLMVHCYEYYNGKIVDLVSVDETNQIHSQKQSVDFIQQAIDKTSSLGKNFQGKPSIIVHPGGYSLHELTADEIKIMKGKIVNAVNQLDFKDVSFLLENMPPYGWFYGGRWNSNIFLEASDLVDYCEETGLKVCFDICHSQLYCNKANFSIIDELKKIEKYAVHYHLADAEGPEGEGLQFGEGDLPFERVIPILNKYNDKSFAIEVWKGHEQGGKGFKYFLDKLLENGLIVQ